MDSFGFKPAQCDSFHCCVCAVPLNIGKKSILLPQVLCPSQFTVTGVLLRLCQTHYNAIACRRESPNNLRAREAARHAQRTGLYLSTIAGSAHGGSAGLLQPIADAGTLKVETVSSIVRLYFNNSDTSKRAPFLYAAPHQWSRATRLQLPTRLAERPSPGDRTGQPFSKPL